MTLAFMWAALALIFAVPIARWQFGNAGDAYLIRIAAAGIPIAILCNFLRETVRLKLKPWAYTISMAGGAVIGTGFALTTCSPFTAGSRACSGACWSGTCSRAWSPSASSRGA